MKFLVDEDVPVEIDRGLRLAGHETVRVAEVLGFRTDDVDIWEYACRRDFIVVTCNRQDFLKLAGEAPATGLIIAPHALMNRCNLSSGRTKPAAPISDLA